MPSEGGHSSVQPCRNPPPAGRATPPTVLDLDSYEQWRRFPGGARHQHTAVWESPTPAWNVTVAGRKEITQSSLSVSTECPERELPRLGRTHYLASSGIVFPTHKNECKDK